MARIFVPARSMPDVTVIVTIRLRPGECTSVAAEFQASDVGAFSLATCTPLIQATNPSLFRTVSSQTGKGVGIGNVERNADEGRGVDVVHLALDVQAHVRRDDGLVRALVNASDLSGGQSSIIEAEIVQQAVVLPPILGIRAAYGLSQGHGLSLSPVPSRGVVALIVENAVDI